MHGSSPAALPTLPTMAHDPGGGAPSPGGGEGAAGDTGGTGSVPGAVRFARYAYPPNALGYCGPADAQGFLGAAVEGADLHALAVRAAAFTGAWPYLQLVAAANGIDDPLDGRVVDAYWVGNELLDTVPADALADLVHDRFAMRPGGLALPGRDDPAGAGGAGDPASGAAAAAAGCRAHHSFHVFAVYPWLGLLRRGMDGPPLTVLDRCRIRPGTVEEVGGDTAAVRSRPLVHHRGRLAFGDERLEEVRHGVEGVGLVGPLRPGDTVAMHWDWVCERLEPARARRLDAATRHTLDVVNTLGSDARGPGAQSSGRSASRPGARRTTR